MLRRTINTSALFNLTTGLHLLGSVQTGRDTGEPVQIPTAFCKIGLGISLRIFPEESD